MSNNKNEDKFVHVEGILKQNEDIRYEMMLRNYWGDSAYTQYGEGIGKYHDVKTRDVHPKASGASLLEYTWGKMDEIGDKIYHQYAVPSQDKPLVFSVEPYEEDMHKWEGEYPDIFTEDNKLTDVAQGKYADLSLLNTYMNEDRALDKKYLTPTLVNVYGSNPEFNGKMGFFDVYSRNGEEYNYQSGRIADIPEAEEVRIIDYYYGIVNNNAKYYLDQVLNNSIKYNYNKGYTNTNYSTRDYQYIDDLNWENIKHSNGSVSVLDSRYSHQTVHVSVNGGVTEDVYNEGDVVYSDNKLEIGQDDENEFVEYQEIPENNSLMGKTYQSRSLLSKTNELFKKHQIATMVGRFHTSPSDFLNNDYDEPELTDTAKRKGLGNSHGRNLLKKERTTDNGYDNPYCRVWTYHHQYDKLNKLIRPFKDTEAGGSIAETQKMNEKFRASFGDNKVVLNGGDYLAQNTVLGNNGIVNIAPKGKNGSDVPITKCMFSIENLAWKDVPKKNEYISPEQTGPNGGRIMWFPPYDLELQESINVDWDQNTFIGRGEKVYTYKNTDRTANLSFTLLIDHPNVINYLSKETNNTVTNNTDDDILRFFAGCQKLEIDTSELEDADTPEPLTKIKTIAPQHIKEVEFAVFFPNNYSGNMNYINEDTAKVGECADRDWVNYLLMGNGCVFEGGTMVRGYECTHRDGISYDEQELWINTLPASKDPNCSEVWKEPKKNNRCYSKDSDVSSKDHYYYRRDFDLCYRMSEPNYKDPKSYLLNVLPYTGGCANFSFAEIVIALLETGKYDISKDVLIHTVGTPDDFDTQPDYEIRGTAKDMTELERIAKNLGKDDEGKVAYIAEKLIINKEEYNNVVVVFMDKDSPMPWQTPDFSFGKLDEVVVKTTDFEENLEDYCRYYRNVIGYKDEKEPIEEYDERVKESFDRIDILKEIFMHHEVVKITIKGCATLQDKRNSKLLAKRRAWAIKSFLKKFFNENIITWEVDNLTSGEYPGNTVNSLIAKEERRAFVTISYINDETLDFSDSGSFNEGYVPYRYFKENLKECDVEGKHTAYIDTLCNFIRESNADRDMKILLAKLICEKIQGGTTDLNTLELLYDFMGSIPKEEENFYNEEFLKTFNKDIFTYNQQEAIDNYGRAYSGMYLYKSDRYKEYEEEVKRTSENLNRIEQEMREKDVSEESIENEYAEAKREYEVALNKFNNFRRTAFIPETLIKMKEITKKEISDIRNAWLNSDDIQRIKEEENSYETPVTIEENLPPSEEGTETPESDIVTEESVVVQPVEYVPTRYETEAEYFAKLQETDPIVFKSIKKKFAYFNPAFHSISPEGFNARLNFLHQCTRQGHTIEASDGAYALTAGNLSFGRMPVCVLRLGDFINTRIVITNIGINYSNNGIQWDLNPEGAGVQPMYAKVNMSIVILGGQSLKGPISRLQNAVSFDYYANTGVYDDRADRIEIEPSTGQIERRLVGKNSNDEEYITTQVSDIDKYKETYTHMFTPYPSWREREEKTN